ncbi:MAG: DUF5686 family protein [Bacteroidaceae bacterium]
MSQRLFPFVLLYLFLFTLPSVAQRITGIVTDSVSGERLAYVNVRYNGYETKTHTDEAGQFSIDLHRGALLTFSYMGYAKQTVTISSNTKVLHIKLGLNARNIGSTMVKGKRKKYNRKDNPAVALMRKVIAAKKHTDLREHDFYRYEQYEKLTFSLNEFTSKVFEEGNFKNMPFLKDHVEICNETGKLTLPVTFNENVSEHIYRKNPKTEKTIVKAQTSTGINELFNTGEIVNTMLHDAFTNVNIYDETVRMLRHPFVSPISTRNAINFYRYFLMDTTYVGNNRCVEVSFTPNNPQDFGFSGSLFITTDSTYRVRKVSLNIPKNSDVNFVKDLQVEQEYATLPSGEQILLYDEMLVQLELTEFVSKFMVRRSTKYSNYDFSEIPNQAFKIKGPQRIEPNAMMRDESFWTKHRAVPLSESENKMPSFLKEMQNVKHFKLALFVLKAFIENFVETTTDPKKPSKIDIGPVNTLISQNYIDGVRLRASAQTTANLNPHLFGRGYIAYGFKDQRWKGLGELTYAFHKKAYSPYEFPINNITASYKSDVMSPSDKLLPTDKDNVFNSFKIKTVDQMVYTKTLKLKYDVEWANGIHLTTQLKREESEPTGKLFFKKLNTSTTTELVKTMTTTDVMLGINFSPGTTYINTKQRRLTTNKNAPIFTLNHTMGLNGILGGEYSYNLTEASIYKRFWLNSWGKIEVNLNGGVQWNKVPFPLLIMPAANLSYLKQSKMFSLIGNMEFLNDRYASLIMGWDMKGKVFNRIPLLRKLKWREFLGVSVLWGSLSNKNNPMLKENTNDNRLFYFPGYVHRDGTFNYSSTSMNSKVPYVEVSAGIHNIFKLLHVEYVRRLNYLNKPDINKWGLRLMMRMTF